MPHAPPGTVSRTDLLDQVRELVDSIPGVDPMSDAQLRRWRDEGLLPSPRRVGQGRGRGTTSFYPWWTPIQAAELAARLARRRNLDDAGWALWVLGFPVTPFVQDLLLDELDVAMDEWRAIADENADLAGQLARSQDPFVTEMATVVPRDRLPGVFRMVADLELGDRRVLQRADDDWLRLQDSTVAAAFPDSQDDDDLPVPVEMVRTAVDRAPSYQLPAVREWVAVVPEPELCLARDAAQAILDWIAPRMHQAAGLIDRGVFTSFLKSAWIDPESRRETIAFLKWIGHEAPPVSPLARQVQDWRAQQSHPESA